MSLNFTGDTDPNVADQNEATALQMTPPGYMTPAVHPSQIEQATPVYPVDILPIRLLKVAGIAHGVPPGMTREAAGDRLLELGAPVPAPVMQIANIDDEVTLTELAPEPEHG